MFIRPETCTSKIADALTAASGKVAAHIRLTDNQASRRGEGGGGRTHELVVGNVEVAQHAVLLILLGVCLVGEVIQGAAELVVAEVQQDEVLQLSQGAWHRACGPLSSDLRSRAVGHGVLWGCGTLPCVHRKTLRA